MRCALLARSYDRTDSEARRMGSIVKLQPDDVPRLSPAAAYVLRGR